MIMLVFRQPIWFLDFVFQCGFPMYVFLLLLFLSVVASFAAGIPSQQIMLRVVPFQQRALGIGVHWTFLRLFGYIPGGIIFGLMIDTTCLKWQESACGKKQSCHVYDPHRLSWTIMAVAIVCKLVSVLATIVGYVTYRPNDLDSAISIKTIDSRGPISLMIIDNDRRLESDELRRTKMDIWSYKSSWYCLRSRPLRCVYDRPYIWTRSEAERIMNSKYYELEAERGLINFDKFFKNSVYFDV